MTTTHRCGYILERVTGFGMPISWYAELETSNELETCPHCTESLCDTDMQTDDGAWLYMAHPTDWSIERRTAWDRDASIRAGIAQ